MHYIGSKKNLIGFIDSTIKKRTSIKNKTVCDLFSGTGIVSLYFKENDAKKVISNDIQYYSYCMTKALLVNKDFLKFNKILNTNKNSIKEISLIINSLKPKSGFITNNYSPESFSTCGIERKYFTIENAKKIDSSMEYIHSLKGSISEDEYCYLVASLIESVDKVSNIASVYGAFLKSFKKNATNEFLFRPIPISTNKSNFTHEAYNIDSNDLIKKINCDILYLDPPYNRRQYCSNYHILETIATNIQGIPKGITGIITDDDKKSKYCRKSTIEDVFVELINNANTNSIFISYNDEGFLSKEQIIQVLNRNFKDCGIDEKVYKRFKADSRKYKDDTVKEFIFWGKTKK